MKYEESNPAWNAYFKLLLDGRSVRREAEGYNYKYADQWAVEKVVNDLCQTHGFVVKQSIRSQGGDQYFVAELIHKSGDTVNEAQIKLSESFFDDAQKIGSAQTYYRRYTKLLLLNIITESLDDDDGALAKSKLSEELPPLEMTLEEALNSTMPFGKKTGQKLSTLKTNDLKWLAYECKGKKPETVRASTAARIILQGEDAAFGPDELNPPLPEEF